MAPLNDEQLGQIRDERKEQIMMAALKVFARRGLTGTKMSMIAEEAGISHGLLYHYFKSKDELFTTLVEGAMAEAHAEIMNLSKLPGSPIEKIRALTNAILDENGAPYFMLIHQARTGEGVPDKVLALMEKYSMNAFIEYLLPVFLEGQQAGQIAAGNLEELISTYFTVLSGIMVVNAYDNGGYRIPEADIILRMITG